MGINYVQIVVLAAQPSLLISHGSHFVFMCTPQTRFTFCTWRVLTANDCFAVANENYKRRRRKTLTRQLIFRKICRLSVLS